MTTTMTIIHYGVNYYNEQLVENINDLEKQLKESDYKKWIHIEGFHEKEKIHDVLKLLQIDAATIDTIHDINERPKCDLRNDYISFIVKLTRLQQIKKLQHNLQSDKIYFIFNDKFVLTIHDSIEPIFVGVKKSLKEGNHQLASENTIYLSYILMDTLIDAFVPAIEVYEDLVDKLEDQAILLPTNKTFITIHELKKHLIETKKTLGHFTENLRVFLKTPPNYISSKYLSLFQGNLEEVSKYLDIIEGYKESIAGLVDLYFSSQGNKLNEIMKILTIVATIFTPLAYLTGVFGMNFYPESEIWNPVKLNDPWGYVIFILSGVFIIGYMMLLFKRKGWIGMDEPKLPNLTTKRKK